MTPPSLLELAQRGNPEAIAHILDEALRPHAVTPSVDREEGRLIIGLYGDTVPSTDLATVVAEELRSLDLELVKTVRLFGYQTGQFVPRWSQRILLDSPPAPASPTPIADDPLPTPDPPNPQHPSTDYDHFIVCGLGSLGQYCIANLRRFATDEFGIRVTAIDSAMPTLWDVDDLPLFLDQHLILGDCCRDEVLHRAGIQDCRAILIVTTHESTNIETAIAARKLNPKVRIVVRSSRDNLNQLLKQQLGNFVALEPTALPAPSFALAGLGEGTLGFFNIGEHRLRVVEQTIQPNDVRFDSLSAHLIHRRSHRLLRFVPAQPNREVTLNAPASASTSFYQWHPDSKLQVGDQIAYVELMDAIALPPPPPATQTAQQWLRQTWTGLSQIHQRFQQWRDWVHQQHSRQLVSGGLLTALVLWVLGTVLLKLSLPTMSWQKAVSTGVVLLLGGYGDVFGGLENDPVPWGVQVICLLITGVSLLFILGVLGVIADNLLSSRFEFLRRRLPLPSADHIVVIGLGRVGEQIVALLQNFRQPLVVISETMERLHQFPHIPIRVGNSIAELSKVNIATARSLIVVTDDQMLNLEAALIARNSARQLGRDINLVIRTYDQRFSDNLMGLLPDAKALCAYELSAEAFAGAAFGEIMLSLFRLNNQTILVADYIITPHDTLDGVLLAEVAYGYGVVPIYHQKGGTALTGDISDCLMPGDDLRLHAGDRLVVLASINGLRRIERGEQMPPRQWRLTVGKPLNQSFIHYSGNDLARITGCNLDEARAFMERLPGAMDLPLYEYQAHRLLRELGKQLPVTLEALSDSSQSPLVSPEV